MKSFVSLRMCVACREMKPKNKLFRMVKAEPDSEEKVVIDITGKKKTRGAYICDNIECINNAQKRKSIERAFKVGVGTKIYDDLRQKVETDSK